MSRILRPAGGPCAGTARAPGDKSISHRVALMGALATGTCRARGWLDAQDTRRTLAAVVALGARARLRDGALTVDPGDFPPPCAPDAAGPDLPEVVLDCGNSATTARLLLGLLAGRRARAVLDGDASLRARPMERVAAPLRRLGAAIEWLDRPGHLPARVSGRPLHGATVELPVASAQVKSALLLAGLSADGPVTLTNCGATRDHTERLLRLMGAGPVQAAGDGSALTSAPARALAPFDLDVPGDPSSAAFLLAAALMAPGSAVTVRDVLIGPTRAGFWRVLQRMGARVAIAPAPGAADAWEPTGAVTVSGGALRPFTIGPAEVPSLVDELPLLAVIATQAEGVSAVTGAGELRVKESDRLAAIAAGLRALGADIDERPDGFAVRGPCALRALVASGRGALLRTGGDHRIAMALAVAALAAAGECRLDDDACVAISFPGFFAELDSLRPRGR